jgi:small-conductance mechanosensitive channel
MKTKKYWLRVGILFFALAGILSLIGVNCGALRSGFENLGCTLYIIPVDLPLFIIIMPLLFLFGSDSSSIEFQNITFTIFGIIAWTVIGMIIGWLYGKIKNRNKIA